MDNGRRVNVTAKVSEQLLAAIDAAAERARRSRSVLIAETLAVAFPVDGSIPPVRATPARAAAKVADKAPREAKARTGMCPHRVGAGAYCKRCADA